MEFTQEVLSHDLMNLCEYDFVMKYIIKSPNWYFYSYMCQEASKAVEAQDSFCEIVSKGFGLSFHSAQMVGSAKTGFSLSPQKKLRPFIIEAAADGIVSDIDVAIVSDKLFLEAWDVLRKARQLEVISKERYQRVVCEIFRGYINDKTLCTFSSSRKYWKEKTGRVTQQLQATLGIVHPISFRVYRSWEDLQEYQIESVRGLKEAMNSEGA